MKYNNNISYHFVSKTFPDIPQFCIIGRCTCGSRHYSENMTYERALSMMPKYIGVVEYFGGGTVELVDNNGIVLKYKHVR